MLTGSHCIKGTNFWASKWRERNAKIVSMIQMQISKVLQWDQVSFVPEKTTVSCCSTISVHSKVSQHEGSCRWCWKQPCVPVSLDLGSNCMIMEFDVYEDCSPVVAEEDVVVPNQNEGIDMNV